MKYLDYFKQCLNTDYLYKLDWYFSIFLTSNKDNKYVKRSDKQIEVLLNDNWIIIEDARPGLPVLLFSDEIKLNKGEILNLKQDVVTKIGRVIFNQIALVRNFGDKIEYINEKTSIEHVESIISKGLINNKLLIAEYLRFTDACSFIEQLSPITNISATYKNMLPPPNLDKKKKELEKAFEAKYGSDWKKVRSYVVEFQEELKKIDSEWLEDDPTKDKLLKGKIKDNARVKMYLTFGPEVGFNKDGSKVTFVENSLLNQYPKDKEQLVAVFNRIRASSYDRGANTAKGGEASKDVLRALSSYRIAKGDCKSTEGKTLLVTKELAPSLMGRYLIQGSNIVEITNPNDYIGKTITIRSPMYCKHKAPDFCSVCCGKLVENTPNVISSMGANITGSIMNLSMKSMHNTQVKLKTINITDMLI